MNVILKRGIKKAERAIKAFLPPEALLSFKHFRHRRDVSSFKSYVVHKRVGAVEFDFFVGDSTGKKWYSKNTTSETPEMDALHSLLIKPGDTVLECGAHHGYLTLLLSSWVGDQGKVIAFEPSETSFDILKKNIKINDRENIVPRMAAIGRKKGTIKISDSSCATVTGENIGYPVEMLPLDEFQHLKPDVIKIDVEGYEADVLKGASEILKSKPKIAIELHTELLPLYHTSVSEVFSLFNAEQYNIWIQWTSDEKAILYKGEEINKRVHLFCIPKSDQSPQESP